MMHKTFWQRCGRLWGQGLLLFGLRLAQNRTGFDPETGLSRPSVPGTVLVVCLIVCAAAELVLSARRSGEKADFANAFAPPEQKEMAAMVAGCFLLAAGGVLLLLGALPQRGIAAMTAGALAAAAGAGFLLMIRHLRAGEDVSVFCALPSMFFAVFFVLAMYLPEESDPVLARFYVPVLAAAFTAYAFSQLAGFLQRESSPRSFVRAADLAVLLCLTAMADCLNAESLGRLMLFGSCAVLLGSFLQLLRDPAQDAP